MTTNYSTGPLGLLNQTLVSPLPGRWELASQLMADALGGGFSPVEIVMEDQWVCVYSAAGWVQDWHFELPDGLPPATELGQFGIRPQVWLHLVDGCVALLRRGSWSCLVGSEVPAEPRSDRAKLDGVAVRGVAVRSAWSMQADRPHRE